MTINCSDATEVQTALHNLRELGWTIDVEQSTEGWVGVARKRTWTCRTVPEKSEYLAGRTVVKIIMRL